MLMNETYSWYVSSMEKSLNGVAYKTLHRLGMWKVNCRLEHPSGEDEGIRDEGKREVDRSPLYPDVEKP